MTREVNANQPQQAHQADIPEDPNFNLALFKLPAETRVPVPCTGIVQRIAAYLLARLPSLAARDQHDARFVLAVVSDWQDLDDEMRNIVFQRLNIYTIVANYGWPTAIASSTAVQTTPSNYLLPPGVQLVQQQRNNQARQAGQQARQPTSSGTGPGPCAAPSSGTWKRRQTPKLICSYLYSKFSPGPNSMGSCFIPFLPGRELV